MNGFSLWYIMTWQGFANGVHESSPHLTEANPKCYAEFGKQGGNPILFFLRFIKMATFQCGYAQLRWWTRGKAYGVQGYLAGRWALKIWAMYRKGCPQLCFERMRKSLAQIMESMSLIFNLQGCRLYPHQWPWSWKWVQFKRSSLSSCSLLWETLWAAQVYQKQDQGLGIPSELNSHTCEYSSPETRNG